MDACTDEQRAEDRATVGALMKEYPRLDQFLAETLVWAYRTGNLYLDTEVNDADSAK